MASGEVQLKKKKKAIGIIINIKKKMRSRLIFMVTGNAFSEFIQFTQKHNIKCVNSYIYGSPVPKADCLAPSRAV